MIYYISICLCASVSCSLHSLQPSCPRPMTSPSIPPSPPAIPHRNWLELPAELTSSILQRLGTVGVLVSARKVCKTWRTICSDPAMWRVVNLGHSCNFHVSDLGLESEMEKLAKKAVDLSCGQLVEFSVQDFASDELLRYVSERYNGFCLLLVFYNFTNVGLVNLLLDILLCV